MNRLSAIRWLGTKIGKPNLGYDSNREFGLRGRSPSGGSKAETLTVFVTRKVADPYIRVSLKLQAAFGLRRSEAMKIQPRWADRGDKLALKGSWTKGGRWPGRWSTASAAGIPSTCSSTRDTGSAR